MRVVDVCCGRGGVEGESGMMIDAVVLKVLDWNVKNTVAGV